MQRTTLIASVTISSLLVAGIAWAGGAVLDDDLDADPAAASATPDDDGSPDDDPSSPDDSATPDDSASPDDSPTPDDSSSPGDDAPLSSPVVASHRALEAGSVTVEAEGTSVRLLEVVTADGWREEVEVSEGLEVEVTFRRDGARIDLKAEVDDGQLRFRVRDRRTEERTETYVSEDGSTSVGDDGTDDDDSGDRSGSDDDGRDDDSDDRSGSDDDGPDDDSDDDSDDDNGSDDDDSDDDDDDSDDSDDSDHDSDDDDDDDDGDDD